MESVIEVLRELDKNSLSLFGENSITYSDGKEEIKISYRRLKEEKKKKNKTKKWKNY